MKSLCISVNNKQVGYLERDSGRGSKFTYDHNVAPKDALSLTMPPRLEPYTTNSGLLPIFDVSLPEGFLRDKIVEYIKRTKPQVDAFDILEYTGGNQIGRVKALSKEGNANSPSLEENTNSPLLEEISLDTPEGVESLLEKDFSIDFIDEIVNKFALSSGVSGAMPKVSITPFKNVDSITFPISDYILKFDGEDHPFLSLNEFFCLEAARESGLKVANARLSRDAHLLMVDRFDVLPNGTYSGFEDFASLNGKTSGRKYDGSIETALFKRLAGISKENKAKNLEELFRLCVVNVAIRNCDAHLKNCAVLYEDAENGPFALSPCYDLVTTRVYDKTDIMSLMLGGSRKWPKQKALIQLGMERADLSKKRSLNIIKEVGEGIRKTFPKMLDTFESHGGIDMGNEIAEQWNDGLVNSLETEPYVFKEENGMKY